MEKNIALVISKISGGGAERVVSNLSLHFPSDWHIDIIVNNISQRDYAYKGELINLKLGSGNMTNPFFQGKIFFRRIRVLRKLKKRKKYAAVISFLDSANIANIVSGKKHTKLIVSVRNYISVDTSFIYKYIVGPMIKLLYNKSDMVVSPSKGIANDLTNHFHIKQDKIRIISNGYDLKKINSLKLKELSSEQKKLFDDGLILVTAGRLEKQKGQWHLIRAMKYIVTIYPNAKLLILGQGRLKNYLEELIHGYALENNVFLLGFQKNPFNIMYNADIYVFSSLFEGFPNALAEALACNLPVISTDFRSGCREILSPGSNVEFQQKEKIEEGEYGLIVPVCSETMYGTNVELDQEEILLAQAILKMIQNKNLRYRYKDLASKRVQSLNVESMVNNWIKLIEELNN